ncbi:hypothetical protein KCP74_02005 [Salmonella enterica subsp. enterica]|nr:hypothetical protein KCP74_02005 [Salmonella enterica subsp. enterica]
MKHAGRTRIVGRRTDHHVGQTVEVLVPMLRPSGFVRRWRPTLRRFETGSGRDVATLTGACVI